MKTIVKNISFLEKRNIYFCTFFAFLLTNFYVVGFLLTNNFSLTINNILIAALISLLVCFPFGLILNILDSKMSSFFNKHSGDDSAQQKRTFILYFFAIFVLWLVVFLAYYPGLFNYDVFMQIPQNIGSYSTHHPLLHTIMLQFFYYLFGDNHNSGLVIYTLIQMAALAFSFSYEIFALRKLNTNKKFRVACIIWISITPIFSLLSISMTKDILFTAFFIVFVVNLCLISFEEKYLDSNGFLVLTGLSVVFVALFRNNGLYIVLITSMFLIIKYRKKVKLCLFLLFSILIIFFINNLLVYVLSASNDTINEMLSIPYQQISRTYLYEQNSISNDDKEIIKKLIPTIKRYNPFKADEVKDFGRASYSINDFIGVYIKYLIKFPNRYLEAFLYNTMGYWYIGDDSSSSIYGEGLENRQGYLPTDTKKGFGVTHTSYFPALEQLYESLFSDNKYKEIPILSIVFNISLYLWILIFCITKILINKKLLIPVLPIMLLIFTLFLGPCVLVRYAFPYISVLPIITCLAYKK